LPWRDEETILGPTQRLTPEGFLLCQAVPIARTGEQQYHASELPMLGMRDGMISVDREPAEVFDAASIASFAGKPIVDDHPMDMIDPDNITAHQIGTVTNVRASPGDGVLLADLLFTTRRGIELVRGGKRGVSVGYDARYEQTGPDTARQRRIRANHVALVDEARCGPVCSIGDSAKGGTMTLSEARAVLKAGPRPGAEAYVRYSTAAAVVYMAHEQRAGRMTEERAARMTTDAKPREESSREYVAKLAKQWRDDEAARERLVSQEMPMPDGIMPAPPRIDPRTGIPLPAFAWAVPRAIATMSGADVAKTYRANDAARSNFLLRRINQLNASFWRKTE
jgi:hypothetical protein